MQTRNIRALSCLVLALGAGCADFDRDTPLPVGPTDTGDDDEASASTDDDSDGSDDRGDDGSDDGSDSSEPPPSNDPEPPVCPGSEIGEACDVNGDCCDYESGDALCVTDGVNTICHQTCTSDSECGSGCCGETDSGDGVCVPEVYCDVCDAYPGEACTQNDDCCGYYEGDASCVNFSVEGLYCSATCIWGSDCNSGCCVALDNGLGACAPDYYCGAAPEETETELDEATSQSEPNASYERAVSL